MIMKKIVESILVLGLLVSCVKQEAYAPQSPDIKFNVSEFSTKGVPVTLATLNSFQVTAVTANGVYFKDMNVTSADGGQTWTSDARYLWPAETLSFFAWSYANGTVSIDEKSQTISDFTVVGNVDQQKDFVVASATQNGTEEGKSTVSLCFNHATAAISIKAANYSDVYNVKVYGVKIGDIRDKDTFTFPAGGAAVLSANWNSWAVSDHSAATDADYSVTYQEPVVLGKDAKLVSTDKSFFLVPQNLNKWKAVNALTNTPDNEGSYLSLLVEITTKDGYSIYPKNPSYIKSGVHAAWDAVGVDLKLEAGKVNSYCINFFKDGGAGQQDPEDPEDDDKGGDPILGAPLSLNVSVEPWEAGTEQLINMN